MKRFSMRKRALAGYTLLELMTTLVILALLAAVAIPSYLKFVKRSKTSEAMLGLRKIFDSSVSYFGSTHVDSSNTVLPPQFPDDGPLTPSAIPAGVKGNPETFTSEWEHATWQALNFSVSDPFYYCYQYVSNPETDFDGHAFGDLDGDEIYSTYIRGGRIVDQEVRGDGGVQRYRDLE